MKKHSSAGDMPSTQTITESTTGQNSGSLGCLDPESIDFDNPSMRTFVATKAKQWGCSPAEARCHLLDPRSIRNYHAEATGPLQSLTLDLPAAHMEEVARLLSGTPDAPRPLKEAAEQCLRQWFLAMITAYGDPFVAPVSLTVRGGQP